MNTLHNVITKLGKKDNLSKSHLYAQESLNLIFVSLIVAAVIVLLSNFLREVEQMRLVTCASFLLLFCIGFIVNFFGNPIIARALLISIGFIGVAIHSFIFGSMELEYLAMLFPISMLLLTETRWFYKVALFFSFLFFLSIKILHILHTPLIISSDTFMLKVVVGTTILFMSFFIISRFKNEMLKAQERSEESNAELQLSIAALQESESRYKAIFDNVFDGILVVDINTLKPVSCNQKMLDYLQIGVLETAKEDIFKYLSEKDAFDLKCHLGTLRKNGKIHKEVKIRTQKGKFLHADITCVLLPPPKEQLTVVIFKDISTEIIAKEKMMEANSELKNFAHAASHDLKEPLRMIRSFGQLLKKNNKKTLSPQNEEFLGYIIDASTRMTTLINDLLEYSTTVNIEQKEQIVDMNDALQICLKNIRLQSIENKTVIYTNVLPQVTGNIAHLVQIFQNIISNAIKFRRREIAPEIRINVLTNKEFHLISILDNGIGIPSEYHEQIFGVFKRLHSKADYEGSGIGLATCKKIIEKKGGKIWVESEPGFGTSFHFTWPVLAKNNQSIAAKPTNHVTV